MCGKCKAVKIENCSQGGVGASLYQSLSEFKNSFQTGVGSGGGPLSKAFAGVFEIPKGVKIIETKGTDGCAAESLPDLIARMMGKKAEPDWSQDDRVNPEVIAAADKLQHDVAGFVDAYKETTKAFLDLDTKYQALVNEHNALVGDHHALKLDFEHTCDELATAKAELEEAFTELRKAKDNVPVFSVGKQLDKSYVLRFNIMKNMLESCGYRVDGDAFSASFAVNFGQ